MKNGRFAPNEEFILVFLIIILHSTFFILHLSEAPILHFFSILCEYFMKIN